MHPRALIALAVVALGMFAYAIFGMLDDGTGAPDRPGPRSARRSAKPPLDDTADPGSTTDARPRRETPIKGLLAAIEGEGNQEEGTGDDTAAPLGGTGAAEPVTLAAARESFDGLMADLAKVAKRRKKISQEQWEEHYRAANDAFAALSAHLEADDPALEEAHHLLQKSLKKLRVRGKKHKEP